MPYAGRPGPRARTGPAAWAVVGVLVAALGVLPGCGRVTAGASAPTTAGSTTTPAPGPHPARPVPSGPPSSATGTRWRELQRVVERVSASNPDMAVAVRELDGLGRSASVKGHKVYRSASTYKLYVAYSVVKRVEAGTWRWSMPVEGAAEGLPEGTTVDRCFTDMIVVSSNACGRTFGMHMIGWATVQAEARDLGLADTSLKALDVRSSVDDQASFLTQLQEGDLMSGADRDKLLALMHHQVYRQGIPAGVDDPVADKVGFLGPLLHDSGIVDSEHGTYVLSVYSSGGTWQDIAAAADRIDDALED